MHRNGSQRTDAEPNGEGDAASLEALRLRYLELFEFSLDGCLATDAQGIVLEANQAAATLLQCSKEFLIGKPLAFFMTDASRARFYQRLALRSHGTLVDRWEARIGRPSAPPREVTVTSAAVFDEQGRLAGFRWLLRDISRDRQTERALRAAEQIFDSLVDATEASILVVDAQGLVLRSNAYLHLVSGLQPLDLQGRRWCDALIAADDQPAAREMLQHALKRGVAKSGVLSFTPRQGPPRATAWSARSLPEGPTAAAVLVGYDVTDLQEAQHKALQAERLAAIGQTAAGLAHEGRNALQRSQACLSLLHLRLQNQPEALDLLGRIQKAQDDLHRLFDDVRSFAAPLHLERVACDLAGVWREAWNDLLAARSYKDAELREEATPSDLCVEVDRFHLKRVYFNLFDNALAAASPARVEVRCRAAAWHDRPAIEVRVRDNGPGFPPAMRPRLFNPFYTTKPHGTGLGLAICRRVVEAHGGRIEAGAAGPGAEVVLLFAPEDAMNPPAPSGLRIAVADDERDTRQFFQELLPHLGHNVVAVAQTGRQLIEQCRSAEPDLVITDIKMPDIDGIEAAAAINRERQTPVVLLSAHHDAELLNRASAEHIMTYLVKPVKPADLQAAVALAVSRFAHLQKVRKESAELRQALEDRKLIERAKGVVVRRLRVEEADAFRKLQKLSSDQNRKLTQIAHQILEAEEVFRALEECHQGR